MPTVDECIKKLHAEGIDTTTISAAELQEAHASGRAPEEILSTKLEELRTQHAELSTTRKELLNRVAAISPAMKEAVEEHFAAEAPPAPKNKPTKERGLVVSVFTIIDDLIFTLFDGMICKKVREIGFPAGLEMVVTADY